MSTHHLEGLEQLISIDELSDYLGVPVKTIVALVRRAPRVQAIALLTFSVVINAHAGMDPIRELVRAGDGWGGSEKEWDSTVSGGPAHDGRRRQLPDVDVVAGDTFGSHV